MCLEGGERGSNGVHCSILLSYCVQLIPSSELQQRRTRSSPEDDVLHMRSTYSRRSTSVSLVEDEIQLSVVWCWAMPKNVKRDTVDSRNTHCELSWTTRIYSSRMRWPYPVVSHGGRGWGKGGGSAQSPPRCSPPPDADLPDADPLDANTALDADPTGHLTCDACWEANPLLGCRPPLDRMTDRCKNITSVCGW